MMTRIVYMIGTSHEYQRGDDSCPECSINEFELYLKKVCNDNSIKAIGEEMSRSALKDYNLTESIPKIFAQKHGVIHKYCDPDSEEQKRLGIKRSGFYSQKKMFPEILQPDEIKNLTHDEADALEWKEDLKREPIWLCKMLELNLWPLLFICGSKHVQSFNRLLVEASLNVKIVNGNWEPKS